MLRPAVHTGLRRVVTDLPGTSPPSTMSGCVASGLILTVGHGIAGRSAVRPSWPGASVSATRS